MSVSLDKYNLGKSSFFEKPKSVSKAKSPPEVLHKKSMLRNIDKEIVGIRNGSEVTGKRIIKHYSWKTKDKDGKDIENSVWRLNPIIGSETLFEKRKKMVIDSKTKKQKVAQKKVYRYEYDAEGRRRYTTVAGKKKYTMSTKFEMVDIPEMSTLDLGNTKEKVTKGLEGFKQAINDGVFDSKFVEVSNTLSKIADRASANRQSKKPKYIVR